MNPINPINPIKTIRETEKKYASLALSIAVAAGLIFFMLSLKPVGKGFILGSLFSVINFILMGETLPMRVGHLRKKASGIALLLILSRFFLMALPLVASIRMAQFNTAATVCGLFLVQAVIMAEHTGGFIYMKVHKKQTF